MPPTRLVAAALTAAAITLSGAVQAQQLGTVADIVFERIDTNRDGVISKDEIQAFRGRMFDRYDTDGDGFITATEAAQERGRAQQRRFASLARIAELHSQMPTPDKRLREADKNGDGKISRDEFINAANYWFDSLSRGEVGLSKSQFAAFLDGTR